MGTVKIEDAGPHIKRITLDRPERLNAISFELAADVHAALDVIAADDDCRVAVLTGAGRGFCAGLDLKDWGEPPRPADPNANVAIGGQEFIANMTQHMRATPQIIVAAVNGVAYGGGLSLAAAADIRIAGESASFCSAFIKTGLSGTDAGISYLLPRLIGVSRAFDMIITGRTVESAEAERLGLVSRVVPDDQLMDEAMTTARQIASYTRTGLRLTKEVLWANVDVPSMGAAIALENRNQMLANHAEDVQEFMAAYRKPRQG